MFKSGDLHMLFEHGFWIWKYLKWAQSYLHDVIYTESVADQTDHLADVFVCENLWKSTDYNILYMKVQCKKRDILMF